MRVDWNKVITELNAKGVTVNRIAKSLDRQWYAIKYWRDKGGEPRFDDGMRLLKMHADICPATT